MPRLAGARPREPGVERAQIRRCLEGNHGARRPLLAVHNEGAPIPAEEMERLFHTFERIEDVKVKGWGLGLPYVRNVAESHGGSVFVDSAEERGTTFTLSLPVDARPYAQR